MRELRDTADAIKKIFVDSPFGYKMPLGQLARIEKMFGPAKIASEDTLPFAFVGGIWLQFILGYKFSTAVWVGYIALFGVAVEAEIVMVEYLQQRMDREGQDKPLKETVIDGALLRIRPIVMTTATTILALMAVMFATGAGSEVMKPVAVPTVGGIVTATMTNLILVPILFYWIKRRNTQNPENNSEK
jgi:Cu/Ag efflux pump CusA